MSLLKRQLHFSHSPSRHRRMKAARIRAQLRAVIRLTDSYGNDVVATSLQIVRDSAHHRHRSVDVLDPLAL